MSLVTLLLLVAGSMWLALLVLQARQESLQLQTHQQTLSAVDYNVFRADENPRRSNTIRSVVVDINKDSNDSFHRLALTNGRLPKGLEIGLPAVDSKNNATEQPITSHSSHKVSKAGPTSRASNETQNSNSHHTSLPSVQKTAPGADSSKQKNHHVTLDSLPSQNGPDSLQILRDRLARANEEQRVLNADKFPKLAPDGVILIVQVHRREGYLKQLFNSMRSVEGIEKVLLVISHDYFYDDMMQLVQTVDFCRVSKRLSWEVL